MNSERRTQERFELHLPVVLLKSPGAAPIRTSTANISNSGFYCRTAEPLSPGDRLRCLIVLPAEENDAEPPCFLEGDAEVIRLLVTEEGFAVGCRLSDYHVIHDGRWPAWASPVQR